VRALVLPLGLVLASCHLPRAEGPPADSGPQIRSVDSPDSVQGGPRSAPPAVERSTGAGAERGAPTAGPLRMRPSIAPAPGRAVADLGSATAPASVEAAPRRLGPAAGSHPEAHEAADVVSGIASALSLVRAGQIGIGLAALEAAFAQHPAVAGPALATVLHQQALNHYGKGELARAEALWCRVAAVDPEHPTAVSFRAAARAERTELGGSVRGPR